MDKLVWISVKEKLPKARELILLKRNETDYPVYGKLFRSKANAISMGLTAPYWESIEEREYHTIRHCNEKDYFTHWALTHSAQRLKA